MSRSAASAVCGVRVAGERGEFRGDGRCGDFGGDDCSGDDCDESRSGEDEVSLSPPEDKEIDSGWALMALPQPRRTRRFPRVLCLGSGGTLAVRMPLSGLRLNPTRFRASPGIGESYG